MIYIGATGYFYQDWISEFYTDKIKPKDWLFFYSRNFNAIELSETPIQKLTRNYLYSIAAETEYKLKICVQLPYDITHKNINHSNINTNIAEAQKLAREWENLYFQSWLGRILFDFPFSFKFTAENFSKVKVLISFFMEYKKTIEFQHSSWLNTEVTDFLSKSSITFCLRDIPKFENQIGISDFLLTSDTPYFKMYGRNPDHWWNPALPEDKTEYLYNSRELTLITTWIKKNIINRSKDSFIILGNIKNANAVKNGLEMRKRFKVQPAIVSDQLELPFVF